jgi:hypothetical protein
MNLAKGCPVMVNEDFPQEQLQVVVTFSSISNHLPNNKSLAQFIFAHYLVFAVFYKR